MTRAFILLFLPVLFTSCEKVTEVITSATAFERNVNIGTGINLGNALEAPVEGEWGLFIEERFIDSISKAGFNSVRLPIYWSGHAKDDYPYRIDNTFLSRVDQIVEWCLERDLTVIITMHHFNEFYEAPDDIQLSQKFYTIWNQLAKHYKRSDHERMIFEPLNEPHGNLTPEKWNQIIPKTLKAIRVYDANRTIILDVPDWANHQSITKLVIPEDESNVIISVRYYLPYEFTHQGAHWAEGSEAWLGRTWTGTAAERSAVSNDMAYVKAWADANDRPVTVGEWGSIIYCDNASRLAWTAFVSSQIREHGFSSDYFDFGVFFRAYDLDNDHWLDGYVEAILGN